MPAKDSIANCKKKPVTLSVFIFIFMAIFRSWVDLIPSFTFSFDFNSALRFFGMMMICIMCVLCVRVFLMT